MIPLSAPDIADAEIHAVVAVLRSGRLSLGPKLLELEQAVAAYIGTRHAIGVSSGTAGIHLALQVLGIDESAEVIVPSFTFVAAANAILYQKATPVFADIDPLTLNMNPAAVEHAITARTRAILLVHTFGIPANLDALLDIAKRHRLHIIEDACEAIGAEYRNKKIGSFGDIGVFSFYPNKPITMGEGGVAVTNNANLAATIQALRNQGRTISDDWLQHSLLGYNYRLPEINCALGIEQLKRLDDILVRREAIAHRYVTILQDLCPEIERPPITIPDSRISWFAFVVRLPPHIPRQQVITQLTHREIGCRAYFPPIHSMPLYARHAISLPVTSDIAARTLALPFFNHITDEQIQEVCQSLRDILQSIKQMPE